MTTNINEAVAKKMGWEWKLVDSNDHSGHRITQVYCWVVGVKPMTGIFYNRCQTLAPEIPPEISLLPNFSADWNATKILIRWMRERGFEWYAPIRESVKVFAWEGDNANGVNRSFIASIKFDNLPLAACESFLLIPDEDLEVKDGRLYEIWVEGVCASGQKQGAHKLGSIWGKDFQSACNSWVKLNPGFAEYYDKDRLTYWGCRLFEDGEEARKSFG